MKVARHQRASNDPVRPHALAEAWLTIALIVAPWSVIGLIVWAWRALP